jgi:hypothetical protein
MAYKNKWMPNTDFVFESMSLAFKKQKKPDKNKWFSGNNLLIV